MLFYRNILGKHVFTYLPCCFIVAFCQEICVPTYHAVLSQHFVTKFVHLATMLFYRKIMSQNLFTYLPCCFIVAFCHKTYSSPYHAVLS